MVQRIRAIGFLCLLAALVASRARAQRITGVVRDSGSRASLPGAVVSTLDAQHQSLARAITDASGRYSVELTASAAQLRVVRIGFQPRVLSLPAARDASQTLDVTMTKVPTLLSTVVVNDDRMCSSDRDRPAALSLWEQARSGLLASIVARESKPANATIISYQRWIDLRSARVLRQTARRQSGRTTRPFVTVTPPHILAQRGYLEERGDERIFIAPDADVLLDESFAETHCFSVRSADTAHAGGIGIAFEPTRGRDEIVDVRGTLWLEAGIPALRSIEFSFVGGNAAAVLGTAAGVIHFRSMPNGVVFVDEWHTRSPVMIQTRDAGRQLRAGAGFPRTSDVMDTRPGNQASENGGIVISAVWADGVRWESPLKPLAGTVTARGTTMPLPGALVALDATGDTVLADAGGHWAIYPVMPGRYEVTAADTSYSAFVAARTTKSDVDVTPAERNDVRLELPRRTESIREICGSEQAPGPTSTLLGRIVDSAGTNRLPGGIRITGTWLGSATLMNGRLSWNNQGDAIELDDKGRFSLCGLPREKTLRLAISRLGVWVADTVIAIGPMIEVAELTWRMNVGALRNPVARQPARVQGRVTRLSPGTPLAGVELWFPSLDRHATTDATGAFVFDSLPPGYQILQVRQLGFAAQRDTLRLAAGRTTVRDFALLAQATQLDTMRTVAAQHVSPALRAFENRRALRTAGYFIAESELRPHGNERLASVLINRAPGLRIVNGENGGTYLASTIKQCRGSAFSAVDRCAPCYVTTYVDGVLKYNADASDERTEPPDFDRTAITELAGIEFYPREGTAPPEYGAARSGCGVLLLWTRER